MVYRTPSKPSSTGRACPRCAAGLVSQAVGPTTIERCAGCQGLWVPAAEFNELILDLDRQEAVREAEPTKAVLEAPVQYIKCPACGATMARSNFARRSGIFVDSCRKHGVWLDVGELRQLVDYLAAPKPETGPAAEPARGARARGRPQESSPKLGQLLGPMPEPLPELQPTLVSRRPMDFWGALIDIVARLIAGA